MKGSRAWLFFVVLLAASAASAAPAPEAKDEVSIPVLPGGVADADGKYGYVTNPDGRVVALDLATGKQLWESKAVGRPLAVMGGWVWVLARDKEKANVLHVHGLALDDGRARLETDPIVLPEWIDATPGEGAGRSFAASARLAVKGLDLFLKWQANKWYWGGAAPSPQVEAAARKHADGVAHVNLYDNQVEMLETDKAPTFGPKVSDKLRNAAARNYGESGLTVATAGDCAVAVDLETAANNKQKVVLKRWELKPEKPLDPVVLAEGALYQVVTLPSAGVTLVRDATPPTGAPPDDWTWTVYDLATGKETAHFTAESRAEDFSVIGPRAYYVVKGSASAGILPRTLKAVDLKTDKRLWEQPLEGERLPPPPPR